MKKLFLLLVSTILLATQGMAQQGWVTHKVSTKLSLKFPDQPIDSNSGALIVSTKDKSTTCAFMLIDMVKFGLDSATLQTVKTSPEFVANIKAGMMEKLPGVNLDDFKIGTWNGFTTYSSSGLNPTTKKTYDYFMIVIGTNVYMLLTVRNDGVGTKDRDDFFASAQLIK